MPPSGRPDDISVLRHAIARIESDGQGIAPSFGANDPPTDHLCEEPWHKDPGWLKAALAPGALHEIVAASPGDAPAACGFTLALAARFAAARGSASPIVWILEDHAKTETGVPYAPGLTMHGLDPARLIMVETANGQESLWAMEEALKCRSVGAVMTELWRLKPYDLTASRRLVLAARKTGTPGLLVPAGAAGAIDRLSSAARTRFEVRAMPGPRTASAGERMPLPGLAAWEIRVARIRAGPLTWKVGMDHDRFQRVLWDHERACFRDAFPLPLLSPARDRQDRAGLVAAR